MPKKKSTKSVSKSSKSSKHQSFKLSPHGYTMDKVILYVVMAALIGFGIGWLFRDQFTSVLGVATY
jgi:hypothetical protein